MAAEWVGQRGEAGGLQFIEVTAGEIAAAAPLVIGLHGRGSNAEDLAGLAPDLETGWRFIFPQAPLAFPGGWGGAYSWYEPIPAAPARMTTARATLQAFLATIHTRLGVGPERSAIIGFSQGAVMTLDMGLRATPPYAALVALSGYLAESDELLAVLTAARAQPLLIAHGITDTVLPIILARQARQSLEAAGLTPEYHEYPIGHEISAAVLTTVATFLRRHLPDGAA